MEYIQIPWCHNDTEIKVFLLTVTKFKAWITQSYSLWKQMKNVPWLHWCGRKSSNWCSSPFVRNFWALDALNSPSWGFYPDSVFQSRSSIVAQAGLDCIVCRAVHSPISSYPELLNELPGRSPQLHSVTPSPASCCFWLNFLDESWIQLVISHCLRSLAWWWKQAVNSLPCLGTVGLCPAEWSPCPCLCAGQPGLLGHLPSWSCPILAAPW